jgi:Xaa-Pro aminopeptidase
MIIGDGIEVSEFVARRDAVLDRLDGAIGLVFAGEQHSTIHGPWSPDPNFYYLTGIRDEPGAAVLLDPRAEDPRRRAILFLKPLNPEIEEWDGYRDRVSQSLRERTGFASVMRSYQLPRWLTTISRKRARLACLHAFAIYDAPVTPDLATFRRVSERSVGLQILDRTNLLPSMRAVKSRSELAVMRSAVDATAAGYQAAARAIRPGVNERDVQRALELGFTDAGARGTGYNSIVGAGLNSTVLHYNTNNQTLRDGDVLLIDAAARVGGYTADVTRTFPINGRFTREQREIYEIVLGALEAATRAVRPGVQMHQVEMVARRIIDKAGYGDAFMHGIGHQLGIEVHDANPDGPLKPGMIVTIEPGIYLPDRKLGIRIEDDILVTPRGRENLTAAIPRRASDIEDMMRRGPRGSARRR